MSRFSEQEKLTEITELLAFSAGKLVIPLYLLFWLGDLNYAPQYKWEFLGLRSLVIPFAIITHIMIKQARTYRAAEYIALFYIFGLAGIINAMIVMLGPDTLYFYGLCLIALGGLSFFPWSAPVFILVVLAIFGPYFGYTFSAITEPYQYRNMSVIAFTSFGIVAITWFIKIFRERLRRQELAIRADLETEIEKRKEIEQELIIARDQALSAARAKESFLANMSHEIRTPLTAIIGYAETSLDSGQSKAEKRSALHTIRHSGEHLLNLINGILDFSKIEAGELGVEKIPINPLQLAAEVESIMLAMADKKALQFRIERSFPLPEEINGDAVRLKQILLNLGSNAIKFTEQGSVSIKLEFTNGDNGNWLKFSVTDTGIGMTDEQIGTIFKPFKQADSSIARRFGGTGLGLSLSKQLAGLLGGSLQVSSVLGEGSVFTLLIPCNVEGQLRLINSANELKTSNMLSIDNTDMDALSGNVLLVDDNEVNLQLISLYLSKMGLFVVTANDGQQAIMLAQQNKFDLVYMDMQMPVMSGVDAVKQLRAENYSGTIIALTANTAREDRELCRQAGFDDFMTKPIVRKQLYDMTAHYLVSARPSGKIMQPLVSELLELEPEYADLVAMFVNELPHVFNNICNTYIVEDWTRLAQLMHDLKSTGGGVGYPELSELAEDVEELLSQQKYKSIGGEIQKMDVICQRIYQAVLLTDKKILY